MVRPRAVASTSCARPLFVMDRVAGSEDAKAQALSSYLKDTFIFTR